MNLRTLKDVDLKGKRVLLRLDLNVPMTKEGLVADETRIVESLPTLQYLMDHGAKTIILSHLGRPEGQVVEKLRLDKIGEALSKHLGKTVKKLNECVGPDVKSCVVDLKEGDVVLLENTRFYKGEEENDPEFAKDLASLGELYVSDAFGTVHRAHASTTGIAQFLPSFAGLLLEKEIRMLGALLVHPEKPMTVIMGGAKIDTKIGLLKNFLGKADSILIGGGLANTFLCAMGHNIGQSLCELEKVQVARDLLEDAEKNSTKIFLPVDVVIAKEISESAETKIVEIDEVPEPYKILDIGPKTIELYCEALEKSKTVVWNGPLGLYEMKIFENGTRSIAKCLSELKATTILGGGDTIDALKRFGISADQFTHVSTGGGAMLEFLQGDMLPGIAALEAK